MIAPFKPVSDDRLANARKPEGFISAWQSKDFFVQLVLDDGTPRMSVNKIKRKANGDWKDGITWDELQAIKSAIGYGETWACEVYPPNSAIINVANIRHLWLLPEAPLFAWNKRT